MDSLTIENTRFSINFSTPTQPQLTKHHVYLYTTPYLSPNLYVINSVDGYLLNEGKNYSFMVVFDASTNYCSKKSIDFSTELNEFNCSNVARAID